ncbi:MAG: hypothetical protein KF870_13940 [Leadbetterella sp.]|nr:hypothetical protein [Leadbetterella sp.]
MRTILICLALSGVICSCTPTFYMPDMQNVPLLTAKKQTNITGAGNGDMINLQLAHAVGDNFGVMLNGALVPDKTDENGNGGKGNYVELGGGYFTPISDNFRFEVYGLAGFGSMRNVNASSANSNPGTTGVFESNITRIGVQPAVGYVSKYFSAAVSSRLASLNYMNPKGSLVWEGEEQVAKISAKSSYFLLEPALTLRAGLPKVKLQYQLTSSLNLTDKDFPQQTTSSSIGLILSL